MSVQKPLPNLFIARFFLALFVVMFHIPDISATMNLPSYNGFAFLQKGHLAVYYFFSLSGFLIVRLIYLELSNSGKFDFKRFYLRRMQRLYPLYYLVLITGILLYHLLLPILKIDFEISYQLSDLVAYYILFLPNVFKYYHPEIGGILIVLWSIGVEEQFYLFIPWFMDFGKKNVIMTLSLLLVLSLIVLVFCPASYRFDNPYFYFLLGGLVAVLSEKHKFCFLQIPFFQLVVLGLVMISFFTNYLDFENIVVNHLVHLTISTFFFTVIAYYPLYIINSRIFNYLGKISYGIYMYHMIVITGVIFIITKAKLNHFLPSLTFIFLLNVIVIGLTILVAHISYQYFEKRFYKSQLSL